jgi:hypothetical protein
MPQRVKYPLTEDAKDAAKKIVEAWNNKLLEQRFTFAELAGDDTVIGTMLFGGSEFDLPTTSVLLELSKFHLLSIESSSRDYQISYTVLLMQELRNAVANDFQVSDFFLTTQAVGTIINAAENSTVAIPALQSGVATFGNVTQTQINTPAELVAQLTQILGQDIMTSYPELAQAVTSIATTPDLNRKHQLGNVILELGRCLQHGANATVVIQAIGLVYQFLNQAHIL